MPSLQFRDNQAGIESAAGFAPARGRFSPREAMSAVGVAERRANPTGNFRLKRRSATRGWFWTWLRGLKPTVTGERRWRRGATRETDRHFPAQASLRDAWLVLGVAPWAEAHGYHRGLAPRGGRPSCKNLRCTRSGGGGADPTDVTRASYGADFHCRTGSSELTASRSEGMPVAVGFSPREAMSAVGVAERRAKPTGDFRLKRRSATRGQRLGNIPLYMVPPGIPLNQVNNACDE